MASHDLQVDYFTCFTPTYSEKRIQFADSVLMTRPPGDLVLDVGCGDGAVLRHLAEQHPQLRYAGIEPSSSYVDMATEGDQPLDVRQGSLLSREDLRPFHGEAGVVLIVSVLHHLVGRTRTASRVLALTALRNSLALLSIDGRLLIFEPAHGPRWLLSVVFWVKRAVSRITGPRRVEAGPFWMNLGAPVVSYYSPEELRAMVAEAGGEVEHVTLVDSRTMGGLIRRERVGMVVRRAEDA